MSRTSRLFAAIPALLALVGFSSCSGTPSPGTTPDPIGGDQRKCEVFVPAAFSSKWPGLVWEHVLDRTCPLTVASSGSEIPFAMNFTVPPQVAYQYYWSAFVVRNNQGQIKKQGSYYDFVPHGYAGNYRSTLYSTYAAATGSVPYLDSAVVTITGGNVYPEFPWFRVMLPAQVMGSPPAISGSTTVPAYYDQSWAAMVSREPTSYRYTWYVDGMAVSTEQYLSVALSEGTHVIRLEAKLSDDVVFVEERTVTAMDCGGPYAC